MTKKLSIVGIRETTKQNQEKIKRQAEEKRLADRRMRWEAFESKVYSTIEKAVENGESHCTVNVDQHKDLVADMRNIYLAEFITELHEGNEEDDREYLSISWEE